MDGDKAEKMAVVEYSDYLLSDRQNAQYGAYCRIIRSSMDRDPAESIAVFEDPKYLFWE